MLLLNKSNSRVIVWSDNDILDVAEFTWFTFFTLTASHKLQHNVGEYYIILLVM